MKKDVIYIDTEDDITSIIDKVKHASAPIVALVPPKRVGVLQSTVNLKLLHRSAESADKRIVLITNDNALVALASTLSLPVAKNLQSKPEIAPISALAVDDGDVIDGNDLPIGELAATGPLDNAQETSEVSGKVPKDSKADFPTIDEPTSAAKTPKKVKPKIPNFDSFRNRLFIFGGLGVLVIAFLVWALFFAATAKISISARTNLVNISRTLTLKPEAQRDIAQGVLPSVSKQVKKTSSIDFEPTGQKQVGEKATGTIRVSKLTQDDYVVAAGTPITDNDSKLVYHTSSAVTIPASQPCFPSYCAQSATVSVIAAEPGVKYNSANGAASSPGLTVSFVNETAGGTDKVVKVVTAEDVAKAADKLSSQDANTVRDELAKQFAGDEIVINEAYSVEPGSPVSAPAVDQEADAAKLTRETTYTLIGIKRSDLKAIYDEYLRAQLKGDTSQKVYKSGDEDTQFSNFQKVEGGYTVQAVGGAQVGPNIDGTKVAEDARGKRVGEVQQSIGSVQGVGNVDVSLSPFWVNRVPGDVKRIDVSFVINND